RYRIGAKVFCEALLSVTARELLPIIEPVIPEDDHEKYVTDIAMALFPRSRLVERVEDELLGGGEQASVHEAYIWLTKRAARYVRLCRRRNRIMSVSDSRLLTVAVRTLPYLLQQHVCLHFESDTIEEL